MLPAVLLLTALSASPPIASPPRCALAAAPDTGLVIEVNEGMEILQVMGWLAQRYPTPPDSRYKTDAWADFGRFRDDSALAPLRTGPLYSDFTELGLLMTRFPQPVVCLPDASSWYQVMGRARVAAILEGAVRFARARIDRTTLTGGAPDGVVRFQFGPEMENSLPSSPSNFAMSENLTALVWHEAGHAFVKPLVAAHAADIDSLARLFDAGNGALKQQGVTTWRYAFEENLVRSVVAVLVGAARGDTAMHEETERQAGRGFVWVPLLANVIRRDYATNRSAFPTFDAFAGHVLHTLATRRDATDTRVTAASTP